MSGEGMAALWGALKSVVRAGDDVIAVDNGLYGHGIGQMASGLGAKVTFITSDPHVCIVVVCTYYYILTL